MLKQQEVMGHIFSLFVCMLPFGFAPLLYFVSFCRKRQMDDAIITKQDMDDKLNADKGWICSHTGNEYMYDFHLKNFPIIIKVASSLSIDLDRPRNKNSDVIRIFAVKKASLDKKAKIVGGLVKTRIVHRDTDWKDNLVMQVLSVIQSSKIVYHKHSRR